jgi:putative endonuclease
MDQKFFTYIIKSLKSGKTYIGQTQDLKSRVKAHNNGFSPYTKGRGPWELIYFEEFLTRSDAKGEIFQDGKRKRIP